ncbi:MAG: DUF3343 domain-containing protein [Oscillospiraceae bacterium]
MKYCVITFANTHSAIATQKLLDGVIDFEIMPTLRDISQSCGISIKLGYDDEPKARQVILNEIDPTMFCFYEVVPENGKNIITKML